MTKLLPMSRFIAQIKDGTHGTHERVESGVPLLSAKNVLDGKLAVSEGESMISKDEAAAITANGFPAKNDILLTTVGTIGRSLVWIDDKPQPFQRSVSFIRLNKRQDPYFFKYYFESKYFQEQLGLLTKVSAQPGVYMGDILKVPGPLLAKDTQTEIANHLDTKTQTLDKILTAKNHTHTHLSELRQAIIDTCILEVGMSNLLTLKRVATMINRGASPDYADDGKAKFINQACIYREGIKLSAAKSANELSHMAGSRGYLHEGDLLVNSTGTGTLGRVAIFDQDNDGTYFADSHVTIVRPDRKKIDPQYLRYVMISTKFQDEVYTMCVSGSTNQIELSRERFRELQIPVPSLERQREIVRQLEERIRNIDAADIALQKSISQLEEYRSSLISNVVGGKIEI